MKREHIVWLVGPLALAACAAHGSAGTSGDREVPHSPESACRELGARPIDRPGLRQGQEAPDFEATDMSGKRWSLRGLRGRPVLLNFWATWCEPCREEMPALETLARQRGGRLTVLTVNVDKDSAAVKSFLPDGSPLTVLLDPEQQVAQRFGAERFPETFLVDGEGRVQQLFYRAKWDSPAAARCLAASL